MANNFSDPGAVGLVGLWDFRAGAEAQDTGLDDGIAQNGHFEGGASASGDQLHTNGHCQFFDVSGVDDPFDLNQGTIQVEFTQDAHVGTSPDSIVNRGEFADRGSEGFFEIRVLKDGSVEVMHCAGGADVILTTDPGTFAPGDTVRVTYTWDAATGGAFVVENLSDPSKSQTLEHTEPGLTMDIGDNDDENFTFGAQEADDGSYRHFFDGQIDYVAIYDRVLTPDTLDGVVEGTNHAETIDVAYTGDPDGDMVDAGDAIDPAAGPDDDVIEAYGGDDTVMAGEGDDEVYAGSGADSVEGGAGDDLIVGDSTGAEVAGGLARESFEWDLQGLDGGDTLTGFTQNTGTVDVTFSILDGDGMRSEFAGNRQLVDGIETDGSAADPRSSLASTVENEGDEGAYALDFSDPVSNVSFRINDIDGDGIVRIQAFDAQGNPIEVNLTGGDNVTLLDTDGVSGADTADSEGGYAGDTSPGYSILVDIPGPVSQIVIEHSQDGSQDTGINVTDVYFDAGVVDDGPDGDDTLIGGDGSDTILGEGGDDLIDASSPGLPLPDLGYPGLFPADGDPDDDRDLVDGGAGDDTITTGDDADTITGGTGDDLIDAGIDADEIEGGEGDDTITGGEGSDTILGGAGDDVIYAGLDPSFPDALNIPDAIDLVPNNGMDVVDGGEGDDTIFGADDDDSLLGGAGDDVIDGGIDEDTIEGGAGDDVIIGGQGADSLLGGDGADVFLSDPTLAGDMIGDVVDGGAGPSLAEDNDTLDLTGSAPEGGSLTVDITGPDSNGNGVNGTVTYRDATGAIVGTMAFSEIENIIPCFTPGTTIATPKGERRVEDLKAGDRVITRDNGIQEIRWIGTKVLDWKGLYQSPHLKPVLIRAGALGNGLPERDMMVSPNHRMLVAGDQTALYFEESEVLVAAKHLVNNSGVHRVDTMATTYVHFMFDNHEVVLSNGSWSESFQPGDYSLKGLGNAQRGEIFELFPELKHREGLESYSAARKTLKRHEARLLIR